jgi:hypothetical protein
MLHTIDPKLVIITFGGVPLIGFAEEKITLSKVEDTFSEMVGCGGETARIRSNNNNWTSKIMFLQTSPSNDYLSRVAMRDELANVGILPFTCRDAIGTTLFFTKGAYIKKPSDFNSGKTVKVNEWNLYLVNVQWNIGGNVL